VPLRKRLYIINVHIINFQGSTCLRAGNRATDDRYAGPRLMHHARVLGIGGSLGTGLIGLAFATTLWVAAPLAAVVGFARMVYMVLSNRMIISSTEARRHGRVTSVIMLPVSATPLAVLVATSAADAIGLQATASLGW
jgi:hypothetical protein